jgi:hypothetical protein
MTADRLATLEPELEAWLGAFEARRREAVKQARFGYLAAGVVGLALFIILSLFQAVSEFAFFAALAVGGMIVAAASAPVVKLRRELKHGLNQRLAEAMDWRYAPAPASPTHFEAFRSHGLVPGHDRRSFEDQFSGVLHGADFELYEAHLRQRRRSKNRTYYVTVFRGVLMRIRFPRTVEGVTLITRDQGWFNGLAKLGHSFSGRDLERIGLVDPTFEKTFEVYGTDQVMARYLLTPTFMERLLDLERLLDGKNVRAVFDESLTPEDGQGELLIAAETGNRFEAGSIFKPLTGSGRVRTLYEELKLIEQIVDTLIAPSDRPETSR